LNGLKFRSRAVHHHAREFSLLSMTWCKACGTCFVFQKA
jgi:hypothetical protein